MQLHMIVTYAMITKEDALVLVEVFSHALIAATTPTRHVVITAPYQEELFSVMKRLTC